MGRRKIRKMRSLVLLLVLAVAMAAPARFEVQLFSSRGAKKMLNNPKFRSMMDDVLSSMERQMEADIRRMERRAARRWTDDDLEEYQPHYSRDAHPTAHMGSHAQSHSTGGRPHHYGAHPHPTGGRPHHYGAHRPHHYGPHPAGHHGPIHGSHPQHHDGERPASSTSSASAGGHHPAHAGHHASCRPRPCPAMVVKCGAGFEVKTPLDETGCPSCPQCVAVAPATEEGSSTNAASTHRPAHCPFFHCPNIHCAKGYELRERKNHRGCKVCPVCVPAVAVTTKKTYLTSRTRPATSAPAEAAYRPHHQLYMGIVPKFVRRYKSGYLYEIKANVPRAPSSDKYQLTIDVKLSKPGWGVEVATFAHPNRHYRIDSEGRARDEVTLHLSKTNLPHVALHMYSPVPLKWTTLALYDPAGLTGFAEGRPSTEGPSAAGGYEYRQGNPFAFFGLTLVIFTVILLMLLIIKCCVRCGQKRHERRERRRNNGGATYQSLPKSEFSTPPPAPLRVYPQTHIAVPQYNPASVEGGALYPNIYAQKE